MAGGEGVGGEEVGAEDVGAEKGLLDASFGERMRNFWVMMPKAKILNFCWGKSSQILRPIFFVTGIKTRTVSPA